MIVANQKMPQKIPKVVYQTWITRDIHPVLQERREAMMKINPDYEFRLVTNAEMDQWVNDNFDGDIRDCYNMLSIVTARCDFWRYLVLFKNGGIYLDFDSEILRPLGELIRDEDECIISGEGCPNCYMQWGLITCANHPIFQYLIELIVNEIKEVRFLKRTDLHNTTGPTIFTRAIVDTHYRSLGGVIYRWGLKRDYDQTFTLKTGHTYRIYGLEYSGFFLFKHKDAHLMYEGTGLVHWQKDHSPLFRDEVSFL